LLFCKVDEEMMEEGGDENNIIAVNEVEEEEEDDEEESGRFEAFTGSAGTTTFITGLSFLLNHKD